MKLLRLALLAASLQAALAVRPSPAQTPPIIPLPKAATLQAGAVDLSHGLAFNPALADPEATSVVAYLRGLLALTHGPEIVSPGTRLAPKLLFVHRSPHPTPSGSADESYSLSLAPTQIRITAATRAGYLYGAISLWQLVGQTSRPVSAWQIDDAPRFRWRGLMLDSARHMQSEEFILKLLDAMAEHKLNVLHWHLTDDQGWRLEIRRYPRLTSVGAFRPQTMPPFQHHPGVPTGPYGGFYTQQQVRHIVAYAMARNITVVPEIELPGHATAPIVAYPELASTDAPPRTMPVGWGIFPNLYNPAPATFTFLHNVLLEVMELFPSPYIHLGGDEAIKQQWKTNPAIQRQIHALGLRDEDALQGWFMGQMETFLNQQGRRMVGWDEILDGGLSPHATVMSWRGMQGGIAAAKLGHDAILSPARPLYLNYRQSAAIDEPPGRDPINSLADIYNFQAAAPELTPAEQTHILGVQGNLWTEYIFTDNHLWHMLFPRAAALAEVAWSSPAALNLSGFLLRLPSDLERTRQAGIRPAVSVFRVHTGVQPDPDGKHATVTLDTQAGMGTIHYTLDGSPVTSSSPAYTAPFDITLPTSLHSLAFAGTTALGQPRNQELSLASSLARDSRELAPCHDQAGIQLEQDPPREPDAPVFRVVFSDPCWIYRGAQMSLFRSLSLSVGSIPYIFHLPGHTLPRPSLSPLTTARLAVYLDTCSGPLLGTAPLQPAYHQDGAIVLPPVSLPPQRSSHDLCLRVEDADPATVWLLHTIQPIPTAPR